MTSIDQGPTVKVAHHAEAGGSGRLTADLLLRVVHELADSGVPPQATLVVRTFQDQRDQDYGWAIEASW